MVLIQKIDTETGDEKQGKIHAEDVDFDILTNIDGGFANSIYLSTQIYDGEGA